MQKQPRNGPRNPNDRECTEVSNWKSVVFTLLSLPFMRVHVASCLRWFMQYIHGELTDFDWCPSFMHLTHEISLVSMCCHNQPGLVRNYYARHVHKKRVLGPKCLTYRQIPNSRPPTATGAKKKHEKSMSFPASFAFFKRWLLHNAWKGRNGISSVEPVMITFSLGGSACMWSHTLHSK